MQYSPKEKNILLNIFLTKEQTGQENTRNISILNKIISKTMLTKWQYFIGCFTKFYLL